MCINIRIYTLLYTKCVISKTTNENINDSIRASTIYLFHLYQKCMCIHKNVSFYTIHTQYAAI